MAAFVLAATLLIARFGPGLVGLTGVHSRWVCAMAGAIMLVLGLVPKVAFLAASIPQAVLGGAALVMFGMVAATGIRILAQVD